MSKKQPLPVGMEYFESVAAGPHVFSMRVAEFAISAIAASKGKIGYYAFLSNDLHSGPVRLESVAGILQGEQLTVDGMCPLIGVNMVSNEYVGRSAMLKQGPKDSIWRFKGVTEHPVYVITTCIIFMDYAKPRAVPISIIASLNEAEAAEFLVKLEAARRSEARKRRCLLEIGGEPFGNFREMKWTEIVLPGNMASQIRDEINTFFASQKAYSKHSLDWRRGMLLAGNPGNGKTSLCRAIATSSKVPVIYCELSDGDFLGMLNSVQKTIARHSPCVAIFEDVDMFVMDDALRTKFLNAFDGIFSNNGVFVVATTNSPEKLDFAFSGRPSRFDSYYVIPEPGIEERSKIIKSKLGGVKIPSKIIQQVIDETEGLSVAFIQEVIARAILLAGNEDRSLIGKDLQEALLVVKSHVKASKDGIENKLIKGAAGFATGLPKISLQQSVE